MWEDLALNWVSRGSGFNHYITWPHLNRKDGAGKKKTMFGQKERGSLQGRFPFLLSPAFLFSGHQHDQTSWKNMHLLPVKPILFLPLSGDHKRANGDSNIPPNSRKWKCLWKVALSLWLRPCASFACPPGLHNWLILWHPTVLDVAHLYFQQILPMVWWLVCASHLFYQTRTIAYHWIPHSSANSYGMSTHIARPCIQL